MVSRSKDAEAELNLPPGFRFHPTDEELVLHYLCRKATHQFLPVPIIAEVDLYKYDPWQLPEMALFGRKEWYFFTLRDRKYPNGSRPNRAAGNGYWKATGADKPVKPEGSNKPLGIKKALVFYDGKAPRGAKTNWIMHEYRLADTTSTAAATNKKGSIRLDDWVLCRLYNKKNDWEKERQQQRYQQQKMSENSFGDAGDSMEVKSDIDNDEFAGGQFNSSDATAVWSNPEVVEGNEIVKEEKEDDGWLMDLNHDELHTSSFGVFSGGMSSCFQQEFSFSSLPSPLPKTPSQLNLLNF